jgi:hypothetical protein
VLAKACSNLTHQPTDQSGVKSWELPASKDVNMEAEEPTVLGTIIKRLVKAQQTEKT